MSKIPKNSKHFPIPGGKNAQNNRLSVLAECIKGYSCCCESHHFKHQLALTAPDMWVSCAFFLLLALASLQPSQPSASPSSQPSPSQPLQNTRAGTQSNTPGHSCCGLSPVLFDPPQSEHNLPDMTLEQITQKYALYWANINKFYNIHFGINLNLTYIRALP